jgi:hypothetical protein
LNEPSAWDRRRNEFFGAAILSRLSIRTRFHLERAMRLEVVSEHAYVEFDMDKKDEKRAQDKQEGHSLPPNATENPMDDTDRNTDKVIDPSQQIPAVE